ncbi:MAG: hypothetical protein ABI832_21425 [bacterium]
MKMITLCAAVMAATLLAAPAARAADMLMDDAGMTLYTFDKDADGKSACYDTCATKWPPYLATAGMDKGEGWSMVDRTDGTMQWAYDGKPVYLFAGDKAKGDMTGDGLGGVWHIIKE